MATVLGVNGMTLVKGSTKFSKSAGEEQSEIYEGPVDKALALYNLYKADPEWTTVDFEKAAGKGTVTISKGVVADDTSESWTVSSQALNKALAQHPYFNPSASIATDLLQMDDAIAKGLDFDTSKADWVPQAKRYMGCRLAGMDSYLDFAPVITHKIIVPAVDEGMEALWSNSNRVVALGDLGVPAGIMGALNKIPVVKAGSFDIEYTSLQWLAKPPQISTIKGGAFFEITYEFLGAEKWWIGYGGENSWDPQKE